MQNYFLGTILAKELDRVDNLIRNIQLKMLEGLKSKSSPLYHKIAFITQKQILPEEKEAELKNILKTYLEKYNLDGLDNDINIEIAIKNIQPTIKKIKNNFQVSDLKDLVLSDNKLMRDLISNCYKDFRYSTKGINTQYFLLKIIKTHGGQPNESNVTKLFNSLKPVAKEILSSALQGKLSLLESEIRNKFQNTTFLDLLKNDKDLKATILESSFSGVSGMSDSIALYFNERGLKFSSDDAMLLFIKEQNHKLITEYISSDIKEKKNRISSHIQNIQVTYGIKVASKYKANEIREIKRAKFYSNIHRVKSSNKIECERNSNRISDKSNRNNEKKVEFTKETKYNELKKGELPYSMTPRQSFERDMV